MITRIEIDGFKSLNEFELDIRQGLNILVGPNGCGKTNIILFFEFLSYLTTEDLYNAVTKVGGAGSIFKKKGERDYQQTIKCSVFGCKKISNDYVQYEYVFSIGISFDKDYLFFKEQTFKAKVVKEFRTDKNKGDWDLHFTQGRANNQSKIPVELIEINIDKFRPRFASEKKKEDKEDIIQNTKKYLSEFNVASVSLIQVAFSFGERNYYIVSDFRSGETFNIVPSKVKQPEDSAKPPGVQKDGSGLANTLYAMKKSRSRNFFSVPYFFSERQAEFSEDTLIKIIDIVKLANPSIQNIDVSNDPFNNQLIVKIFIKGKDDSTVLPLSAMSDGTIKWITLITAILTSREIFSIEEPENFLHPWMQAEIVKIMRNTFNAKQDESFILMTTHSETLLNCSKPEEIIIISLSAGNTLAKRLNNIDLINSEIRSTGFGLGYYYVSNALDNE